MALNDVCLVCLSLSLFVSRCLSLSLFVSHALFVAGWCIFQSLLVSAKTACWKRAFRACTPLSWFRTSRHQEDREGQVVRVVRVVWAQLGCTSTGSTSRAAGCWQGGGERLQGGPPPQPAPYKSSASVFVAASSAASTGTTRFLRSVADVLSALLCA